MSPPDTLAGTVTAQDADGLDSVWVTVDGVEAGQDAFFEQSLVSRFRFLIGVGKTPGTRIPVQVRARDIAGFEATRDTQVVVVQ